MLEVDAVTKSFPGPAGGLTVLDGVSLQLGPSERLTIMGPSGSGKSTLLAVIGGLEPPTAGTVRLDGVDPYSSDAAARAAYRNRRVGFVFQDHHLLGGCTALDNVLLPALAQGRVPVDLVVRGRRLLERVGLAAELSGGERQRVAVARALLLSPRLVIADEPTGQLDSHAAADVASLLLELAAEAGGMLIVATHSESLAARVGGVRHLRDGRLDA